MTDTPSPARVFNIPAEIPFADALVNGLLSGEVVDLDAEDPLALAGITLLMPTRRACRAVHDAFLRASEHQATLLPRIRPLGDIDDDEAGLGDTDAAVGDPIAPAIQPLRRQLMLARLVEAWEKAKQTARPGDEYGTSQIRSMDHIVRLAGALADFLDAAEIEEVDFARLEDLVPDRFADHWQGVLDFLKIVTKAWPDILSEEGVLNPAARRSEVLGRLAVQWQTSPPAGPVIAAGSTGSVPATATLMKCIARLPQGMVVLPGLDMEADAETWAHIDPAHPQFTLRALLEKLGVTRNDVRVWPTPRRMSGNTARARLLGEALRPAPTLAAWASHDEPEDEAIRQLTLAECDDPQQEAGVIALRMRAALLPGNGDASRDSRTAALVTADRGLARRVVAELARWSIAVDDSAGTPLGQTPAGAILRLVARLAENRLSPVDLLAALKHPLASGGQAPGNFRSMARELERRCLRGPRPAPGLAGLREAAGTADDSGPFAEWFQEIGERLAPLDARQTGEPASLAGLVSAHVAFAEWLVSTDANSGHEILWAGEDGEAAAALVTEMMEHASAIGPFAARDYGGLLEALMEGRTVRPRFGLHPRLFIWGPLEARLQRADVMILGGLNEGSWPPEPGDDPWMSRLMRAAFGLPPHERRVGLSAHDFVQAASAGNVMLTRARRSGGGPTVPSRWLTRLDALLGASGTHTVLRTEGERWRHWYRNIATPPGPQEPIAPPAPRPPVAARPRALSVTQVERWMADPYSIYARHILRLKPLEPLEADPGAAERGSIIHNILDTFIARHGANLPADALIQLVSLGRDVFAALESRPGVLAFWWPRFERIAEWFVSTEHVRRRHALPAATEVNGGLDLARPGGPFRLTAKADRIDHLSGGGLAILDYKTGQPPSTPRIERGIAPQLPLEAAIATAGGFEAIPAAAVAELAYWHLSGGDPAGRIAAVKADPETLAADALAGLETLIDTFDDPETPYLSMPRRGWVSPWNDYAHLARVAEWIETAGSEADDDR